MGGVARRTHRAGAAREARLLAGNCIYLRESKTVWSKRKTSRNIREPSKPIAENFLLPVVDLLVLPEATEIYPAGFGSYVTVEGLSDRLEGRSRPGHFRASPPLC